VASLFERLRQRQLTPKKEQQEPEIPRGPLLRPIVPPADHRSSTPAEQLLDFIVNRWPQPVVSVRNVLQFGPGCLRGDRKNIVALTEALAQRGWLASIEVHQHNMKHWRIIRGPES
jgi:hypothetical protein